MEANDTRLLAHDAHHLKYIVFVTVVDLRIIVLIIFTTVYFYFTLYRASIDASALAWDMNAANWRPSPPQTPPGSECLLACSPSVATAASWPAGVASWPDVCTDCCSLPGAFVSLGVISRWMSETMRPIAAPAPRAKMSRLR